MSEYLHKCLHQFFIDAEIAICVKFFKYVLVLTYAF